MMAVKRLTFSSLVFALGILGLGQHQAQADGSSEYSVTIRNESVNEEVGYQCLFSSGGRWRQFKNILWAQPSQSVTFRTGETIDRGNPGADDSWKIKLKIFHRDGRQPQIIDWTRMGWSVRTWTEHLPSTPGGWSNWIDHTDLTLFYTSI